MIHQGGCHGGAIAFSVEGDLENLVECNCSLCSERGYLLWFVPRAQLRLSTPEENLATYTFNTGRIQHHFCPKCGCAPLGSGTDRTGAAMAAVTVRCLENLDWSALPVRHVDGRSL